MIVLRVLTKEEIQKLADRTKELRGKHRHSRNSSSQYDSSPTRDDTQKHASGIDDVSPELQRSTSTYTALPSSTEGGAPKQKGREHLRPKRRAWTVDATKGFMNILKLSLIELSNHTDERAEEERKAAKRKERSRDRRERDEFADDSENEFKPRAPKMLEAPSSTAGASAGDQADFIRENRERRRDREGDYEQQYMSGGLGRRDDYDR